MGQPGVVVAPGEGGDVEGPRGGGAEEVHGRGRGWKVVSRRFATLAERAHSRRGPSRSL